MCFGNLFGQHIRRHQHNKAVKSVDFINTLEGTDDYLFLKHNLVLGKLFLT